MDAHDQRVIHSSNESNYRTPPACFQALDQEFHFYVDAAADRASALCRTWLGPESPEGSNALVLDWYQYADLGALFLNPPFSKTLVNAYNTGRIKIEDEGGERIWVPHEQNPEKAKAYDIANWAEKCWEESQRGATIVGVFPFAPQTEWYRHYVMGHEIVETDAGPRVDWRGHCAREERRLPHRISFLTPDGQPTGNAGVNSVILVWRPNHGIVGPWQPHSFYWSYREAA